MLRGIAHAHSTYSFDGKLQLTDLQRLLTNAQVDFCLMSEHVEGLSYDVIVRMLGEYADMSSRGCLMIPGIEIDDLHILLYGTRVVRPFASVEELAAQMFNGGALVFVSHPVKLRGQLPDLVRPWLTGVEIWNTRYDGRRNPRPGNLALWRKLEHDIGPLQPVIGVDLHSASDLSHVRIEIDCEKKPEAILKSISAGRHRLSVREGKLLDLSGSTVDTETSIWTNLFDSAVAANKHLKKTHLPIPRSLRRIVKKIL
jgi:hypothetical protein